MTAPVSFREKVRFFSLALRAPSIHGTTRSEAQATVCPQPAIADIRAQTASSAGDPPADIDRPILLCCTTRHSHNDVLGCDPRTEGSNEAPRVHHAPPLVPLQVCPF